MTRQGARVLARRAFIPFIGMCALLCAAVGHEQPRLRKAGVKDGLSIWIVDGRYIRDHMDIEFTNFGQHYVFKFIPPKELWLDEEARPDEQRFFVDHLIAERAAMARGLPYDSAVGIGDRVERIERKAAGDLGKVKGANGVADPRKTHEEEWMHTDSNLDVWIVDGRLVRSGFDVEFTEGGHDRVYDYVPHNEVWIDNDLLAAERPFVLLHELHERNLMVKGEPYEEAHADANKSELYFRHHPDELARGLEREKRQ